MNCKFLRDLTIVCCLFSMVFITSCEYYEEDVSHGSYTSFDIYNELKKNPDESGNLEIVNNTNFRYLLYVNDSLNRLIPAPVASFFVYIPTSGGETFNLKLYKRTDLTDGELRSPMPSKLVYQWDVVLPKETWDYYRISWVVDEYQQNETALIEFTYAGEDGLGGLNEYSVDVFLNNKNGEKLLSLSPTYTGSIGLSFGYQVLYFRYWLSNPNSPNGQDVKGWVEKKPNGTAYSLVLNSFNDLLEFQIPAYFEVYPQVNGFMKINNKSENVFYITANGKKFEDFVVLPEGNFTVGLSYVSANDSSEYYRIPVGEYLLKAIIPSSGFEHDTENKYIIENDSLTWVIH